ncbi:MAG: hypothetical protein ACRDYC_03335 [Acidimicrobiales bacterium]
MSQPAFVTPAASDAVRPSDRLEIPEPWYQDRPGDLKEPEAPTGPRLGITGPDLGYGLKLANRLAPELVVPTGESRADAVAGCFVCGARRAATIGRAPVIHDMRWAYLLWGYLGSPPPELVSWRAELFRGAGHDYEVQRQIADSVTPAALRLSPEQVPAALSGWRELLSYSGGRRK